MEVINFEIKNAICNDNNNENEKSNIDNGCRRHHIAGHRTG